MLQYVCCPLGLCRPGRPPHFPPLTTSHKYYYMNPDSCNPCAVKQKGRGSFPKLSSLWREGVIGEWRNGKDLGVRDCGVLHCLRRNLIGRTERNHGKFSEGSWNTDSTWNLTEYKCRTLPLQ